MSKKKKEKETIPFGDDLDELPVYRFVSERKAMYGEPCPICGGCLWVIDDKLKCGWCGERFDL